MANWCFPVNMNLIYFGSLNLEIEEKCLTLKGKGQRNARIIGPTLFAQQSRQQQQPSRGQQQKPSREEELAAQLLVLEQAGSADGRGRVSGTWCPNTLS